MDLVNLDSLKTYKFSAHGGNGQISMKFSFEEQKGIGMWSFLAYAELPVGATCGIHKHEGNDEWFFVISGQATITVDNEKRTIKKGDCILTKSGSEHGIQDVKKKLKFIAVEVNREEKPKPFIFN